MRLPTSWVPCKSPVPHLIDGDNKVRGGQVARVGAAAVMEWNPRHYLQRKNLPRYVKPGALRCVGREGLSPKPKRVSPHKGLSSLPLDTGCPFKATSVPRPALLWTTEERTGFLLSTARAEWRFLQNVSKRKRKIKGNKQNEASSILLVSPLSWFHRAQTLPPPASLPMCPV